MGRISRGSEWRKWDLHVHTPSSYDYKDKSVTNENLIQGFMENGLSVVAITDHNLIDVARINDLKKISSSVVILPGIELCTERRGSDPIHITCIFSENSNINHIWNEMNSKCDIAKQREEMGREDGEIYCKLDDTAKLVKSLGGLIIIHAGKKSNSIENIKNTLKVNMAEKKDIANHIDIFEVNRKSDELDYKEKVWKSLEREVPIIICSDNHKISEYIVGESCWIKSDANFEGLKQILYEPSERIYLGEGIPEDKRDYLVIDKVKFIDDNFSSNEIFLNPNLNSIIGGKSTGKSLLLWAIANTIDPNEVKKRLEEGKISLSYNINNFEVSWKNGIKNSFARPEQSSQKIIYIPQSYLNRLVDEKEDKTAIDEMIETILLQNFKSNEIFENLKKEQREKLKLINSKISDLCFLYEDSSKQQEKLKLIGEREGIQKEIIKLNYEVSKMQEKLNLEKGNLKEYHLLHTELNSINHKIKLSENDLLELTKLGGLNFLNQISLTNLSEETSKSVELEYSSLSKKFKVEWKEIIDKKINELKKIISIEEANSHILSEKLKPLEELFKESKLLVKKMEKLEFEEENLKSFNHEEKILEKIKISIKKTLEELLDNFVSIYNNYISAKTGILEDHDFKDGMKLDINVNLRLAHFKNNFIDKVLDGRRLSTFNEIDLLNYSYKDSAEFVKQVEILIKGIFSKELPLKKEYNQKDALISLLKDWYLFSYSIDQDGDDLSKMSPGKKSLVLLKLLIKLDTSKCPILLDQPEDDLDNRSIYNDLVKFIRERKIERQIIIVTHNPNLVVSADCEEIIVANQQGEQSKNEQYKIEYISGSLEESFIDDSKQEILYKQGIREHVCDILEGGKKAFEKRRQRYSI